MFALGSKAYAWSSSGTSSIKKTIDERFPFHVFGRVTDTEGNPIAGVEVRAATGIATLFFGDPVKTDANGRYKLYITGLRFGNANGPLAVGTQAAIITASLEGYREISNNTQGELMMSSSSPNDLKLHIKPDGKIWGKESIEKIVLPHTPREINFAMTKNP